MTMKTLLLACATLAATASIATAQGDITTFKIGDPGGGIRYYGQNGGIAAYSLLSTSCNIGNVDLTWTSGGGHDHPVISQNLVRLKNRRFEHLGQSWLKHGFCALCESGCGPGTGSGCFPVLRVGCADTYSAGLNDGQGGGPKFTVEPTNGNHLHPDPAAGGNATIKGRLQAQVVDIQPSGNSGAQYFIEGQYIHWEDHQNGYGKNNASWRPVTINSSLAMSVTTLTNVGEPVVEAWKDADPNVTIVELENTNEDSAGVHGYYYIAYRTWDNGDGTWDYSYAVQNLNSTQGAYSFEIPSGSGVNLTNVWFNDVDYHSGEPQDGTDWSMTQGSGDITWTCPETFAQNPDANAINWATVYSYGFTADAAPTAGVGMLTMFEPGVGSVLTAPIDGPGTGVPPVGTPMCFGDGSGALCPCLNVGDAGKGCSNSVTNGAALDGSGNASVTNDTLSLDVTNCRPNMNGLFFGGTTQVNGGNGLPFGDGLRCVGGAISRIQVRTANGSGEVSNTLSISNRDGASAGDTRYYQWWYRDTGSGSPCGNGYNTSSALRVVWGA